jgi:Ran GTPase-activating protein (RanGAP) involved in mRNA processing and transport
LKTLDLGTNSVGSGGAGAFAIFLEKNSESSLTTLNLQNNNLGNEGVLKLAKSLENLNQNSKNSSISSLTTLNLRHNNIGKAAVVQGLAKCLKKNFSLKTLILSWDDMDDNKKFKDQDKAQGLKLEALRKWGGTRVFLDIGTPIWSGVPIWRLTWDRR